MPQTDYKYIFWLHRHDGRNAVVVEVSKNYARQRAHFFSHPSIGWDTAQVSILTRVRNSMTNRVIAIED